MRFIVIPFLSCLLLTAAAAPPAMQMPPETPTMQNPAQQDQAPLDATSPAEKLDNLFTRLKRTRNADAAQAIAAEIWAVWNDSGSATIDFLMRSADMATAKNETATALDYLDEAIALRPGYAESWNRRATLHYKTGNYDKSMADIAKVLIREPRHFGALSGMAAILEETGSDAAALAVWEKVLDVYPANRDAQDHVKTLSDKLAGSKT